MEWLICSGDACTWNGVPFCPLSGTSMELSPSGEKSLSFFSNWVKGGMWKNLTKRFSFFDSIVQSGSKALKIMLKSVPLFGSYHCRSISPQAFKLPSQAFTEASEVWEQESYGQRWYDIKARMVNWRDGICQLAPLCLNWWTPPNLTLSLLQLPSNLSASCALKYNHLFHSNKYRFH